MKTILFVITAIIFMILSWFLLGAMLMTVGYVGAHARQTLGLLDVLHSYFVILTSPAFGGYVATYVTPRLFQSKPPEVLITAFIATFFTLAALFLSLAALQWWQGYLAGRDLGVLLAQVGIALLFAKIGGAAYKGAST